MVIESGNTELHPALDQKARNEYLLCRVLEWLSNGSTTQRRQGTKEAVGNRETEKKDEKEEKKAEWERCKLLKEKQKEERMKEREAKRKQEEQTSDQKASSRCAKTTRNSVSNKEEGSV